MGVFASTEPELGSVTPIGMSTDDLPVGVLTALNEAREFLKFYNWVADIELEFLGIGVDGILYVFLFKIKPSRVNVDTWIWVVVGDVPPAYLTCEDAKNPAEAIDAYLGAMEEWVVAAKIGSSVSALIPVNIPATLENAEMLEKRLKFIDDKILAALR
jgi:hypothetical protein